MSRFTRYEQWSGITADLPTPAQARAMWALLGPVVRLAAWCDYDPHAEYCRVCESTTTTGTTYVEPEGVYVLCPRCAA